MDVGSDFIEQKTAYEIRFSDWSSDVCSSDLVFSFGIFLFFFILFCYFAKLHEGITTNTVLISHIFAAGSLHYTLVLNEFILLCIGVAIGVLVNLYMPQMTKQIRLDQQEIDGCMKCIIGRLAEKLLGTDTDLTRSEERR